MTTITADMVSEQDCLDCQLALTLTRIAPGVYAWQLHHSPTCPSLKETS